MDVTLTDFDSRKCTVYGKFLHELPKRETNAIFWSLFGLDLLLLIIASNFYAKQIDDHQLVRACNTSRGLRF